MVGQPVLYFEYDKVGRLGIGWIDQLRLE